MSFDPKDLPRLKLAFANQNPWHRFWGQPSWIKWSVSLVLGWFILGQFYLIVPAGQAAVLFNTFTGVEDHTLAEGFHFKMPFIQSPTLYDVRTIAYTMSATHDEGDRRGDDALLALTADGQQVKVDITVRYHMDPQKAWALHRYVGPDVSGKVVRPQVQMAVRSVIAERSVQAVYSKERLAVQQEIADNVSKIFKKYYLVLDEALIRNISFSPAYTEAIEQKQVALQEAERMKYVLQKEESEKQRKIIEASGEAQSMRLRAQALRENPQLIQKDRLNTANKPATLKIDYAKEAAGLRPLANAIFDETRKLEALLSGRGFYKSGTRVKTLNDVDASILRIQQLRNALQGSSFSEAYRMGGDAISRAGKVVKDLGLPPARAGYQQGQQVINDARSNAGQAFFQDVAAQTPGFENLPNAVKSVLQREFFMASVNSPQLLKNKALAADYLKNARVELTGK